MENLLAVIGILIALVIMYYGVAMGTDVHTANGVFLMMVSLVGCLVVRIVVEA